MRRILKLVAAGVGVVIILLVLAAGGLYWFGSSKLNRVYEAQLATLIIPDDTLAVARGAHLTKIYGCTDCHGGNLSGQVLVDDPPFRVTASNLTPGGVSGTYSFTDLDRAIRHGLRPDGRALVIMPSSVYNNMADEDISAIIAYLRTLDPIATEHPPTEIRPLGRLLAAGLIDPSYEVRTNAARSAPAPPAAATPEYGEYLVNIICSHCHGADLRGNDAPPAPGSPPAPDLAAAGTWPTAHLIETLRTGVTPAGRQLDPDFMPWRVTAEMTDTELEAVHAYLATLGR